MTLPDVRPESLEREKDVQRDVVALYRGIGCHVTVFSEGRRARITPGTPDLWVQPKNKPGFWHETKSASGEQSEKQAEFQARSQRGGTGYVLGGQGPARAHLQKLGLIA